MFDGVLKITKYYLSDEHSSQLGAINAGQAVIMTSVINLIVFFDIAEAKKSQLKGNSENWSFTLERYPCINKNFWWSRSNSPWLPRILKNGPK